MCAHKIEDYTFVLYNIMFYKYTGKLDECNSLLCKRGKCICIDQEQTGLLRKLLSAPDLITLFDDGTRIAFQNHQNTIREECICKESVPDKALFYNVFYPNKFSLEYKNDILSMIQMSSDSHSIVKDVVQSIPILYAANSLYKFDERHSLIYLCKYTPCAAQYISILLRAVICRTIDCCQNADRAEKEAYVSRLVDFLNFFKVVLNQGNREMKERCIECLDTYAERWEELFGDSKSQPLFYVDELEKYRNILESKEEITLDNRDVETFHNMYCLLKKLLQTADISPLKLWKMPKSLFTAVNLKQSTHTEYHTAIEILDRVKHDTEKLNEIRQTLSQIFARGVDFPSDELAKMQKIAG